MFRLIINWSNIFFLNLHKNTNKQNLQRKTRPQWSKNLVNICKLNFFFMLAPLTYILYAQSHCGHRRTLMPSRLANHFNHLWYVSRTIKSICSWDVHTCTCISRCYQQTCLIRFSTKHNACGILVLLKLTIKDCEMHCGKNYL